MANVSVFNMQGKEVGKMDLNDAIFAAPVHEPSSVREPHPLQG